MLLKVLKSNGLTTGQTEARKPKVLPQTGSKPQYDTVMREIGKPIVFNICVLGGLLGLVDLVRTESVEAAIRDRVAGDFVELNIRALHLGFALGRPHRR